MATAVRTGAQTSTCASSALLESSVSTWSSRRWIRLRGRWRLPRRERRQPRSLNRRITIVPGATDDRDVVSRAVVGCGAVLTVLVPRSTHHYTSGPSVLDYAQPGARLVFSCGWHITRDGQDVYSVKLKRLVKIRGGLARLAGVADLDDQLSSAARQPSALAHIDVAIA